MKTEEIIKRLRNPQAYQKPSAQEQQQLARQQAVQENAVAEKKRNDVILMGVGGLIFLLLVITGIVSFVSKTRSENLNAAIDPEQVKGLQSETEFKPNSGVTHIQLQEGQNRNVDVTQLGSTLPIISRFNYKSFGEQELGVIGAAPWALTNNFASNINDPELIRYLLSKDEVSKAFIAREDVSPLLDDPQLLAAFTEDKNTMARFFGNETVKQVLADEKMVRVVAGSRFMGYLLISKAGRYYREHPQEAAKIIAGNYYLRQLQENPAVQTAVQENHYLKQIATTILDTSAAPPPADPEIANESAKADKKEKK